MKRHISFILLTMVLLVLAGCGKKSEVVVSELTTALLENVSFSEQLTQIDKENIENRYSLNSKDFSEITAFVGTASVCDECVIVKTESPEAMKGKLEKYIENKRKIYEEYRPGEVYKLDNPVIEIYKDAVVMIIADDREGAMKAYEQYLKK